MSMLEVPVCVYVSISKYVWIAFFFNSEEIRKINTQVHSADFSQAQTYPRINLLFLRIYINYYEYIK